MVYVSRFVGVLFAALGAYIFVHAITLLNLQHEVLSIQTHLPLPPNLRIFGGCAGLIFAAVFLVYGLRFIVRPVRT